MKTSKKKPKLPYEVFVCKADPLGDGFATYGAVLRVCDKIPEDTGMFRGKYNRRAAINFFDRQASHIMTVLHELPAGTLDALMVQLLMLHQSELKVRR